MKKTNYPNVINLFSLAIVLLLASPGASLSSAAVAEPIVLSANSRDGGRGQGRRPGACSICGTLAARRYHHEGQTLLEEQQIALELELVGVDPGLGIVR